MVWSNDGARVVLETDPGRAVTVWDVSAGELIAERSDGTYPADLHGDILAYRGGNGDLVLWNIIGNVEINRLPGPVTAFTSSVGFSPDGNQVAYGIANLLHIAVVGSGDEAHKRGLAIGQKNAPDQTRDLVEIYDFAITEDAFYYDWAGEMLPYIQAGKPVFAAEYTDLPGDFDAFCRQSEEVGFSTILKNRGLDAWVQTCQ